MSDHKDKIPFGGRDWNKDGKYDNFDRMTDFYVYKKVTEDWEKNGAWDKPKKPQNQYPDVEKTEEDEIEEAISEVNEDLKLAVAMETGIFDDTDEQNEDNDTDNGINIVEETNEIEENENNILMENEKDIQTENDMKYSTGKSDDDDEDFVFVD